MFTIIAAAMTPPSIGFANQSAVAVRSEEHTSELQSLKRLSYAVFCMKKKKHQTLNTKSEANEERHTNKTNQKTNNIHKPVNYNLYNKIQHNIRHDIIKYRHQYIHKHTLTIQNPTT